MKRAISKYSGVFATILGLAVVSLVVGGFILGQQRFHLPRWVPVLGSDFVEYKVPLSTAKSITPGQGQTVDVAGVPVGEISKVDLVEGRAVVTMKIRKKYTPIYRDATALVRPKTGLEDMVIELIPGSKSSGVLPDGGTLQDERALPTVALDEILSSLDGDTRDYLRMLIGGAGEGLRHEGRRLSSDLKRFAPTGRELNRIGVALAERRVNIRRTIHNFRLLSEALGGKDRQLAALVGSSGAVFARFAHQDASIRSAIGQLPGALRDTQTALVKADALGRTAGPALGALRPAARALGPALRDVRPFLRTTEPVIRTQLRPFARDTRPTIRLLRPAANDLAKLTPDLTQALGVLNYTVNTLAYDKPNDGNESYLFWLAWANHLANTVFATQDAHGPIRRGLIVVSCDGLATLDQLTQTNPQLGTLVRLLNPPNPPACGQTTQAGSGILPGGGIARSSADAARIRLAPRPQGATR